MEVDSVVSQALRGLVAFPTATLEGFPHPDLRAVAVFGMVLDAVDILRRAEGIMHRCCVTIVYYIYDKNLQGGWEKRKDQALCDYG